MVPNNKIDNFQVISVLELVEMFIYCTIIA